MFETFWNVYLYQPLFNVLIWIYNNWTSHNLGWAVIYLTVALRVVLLPFTLIEERDKIKNMELMEEIRRLHKGYQNDPILKKEEIRKTLRKRKVRPWARVFELGIQLLVLVLLYQVFLHGIQGDRVFKTLYSWVNFPGPINTIFYGFQLGKRHDILWAGLVGLFLWTEIYVDYTSHKLKPTKADLFYFILFPFFVAWLLWILPMVKSLFVLTSLLFSVVVHQLMKGFMLGKPKPAGGHH